MPKDQALAIIQQASGSQLCPDCVDAFIKMELWDRATSSQVTSVEKDLAPLLALITRS
jgi:HD-GYP domain-containing protein (c-di-GMP phosphodiesterase class II)